MNFEDESYVKVYKRLTLGMKLSGWDGRAVLRAIFMHVDRAGVLDLDGGEAAEAIAALEDMPIEIARSGMAKLLERGTVQVVHGVLFVPNFMAGQEAKQNDAQRQRESRAARVARKRAMALGLPVTNRDEPVGVPTSASAHQATDHPVSGVSSPHSTDGPVTNRDQRLVVSSHSVTEQTRNPSAGHAQIRSALQRSDQGHPPPPSQDLTGSARERVALVVVNPEDPRVPCPANLELPEAQRTQLESSIGINAYQIGQLTVKFRTSFGTDQGDKRTKAHWLKCLSKAICGDFSNPRLRPPRSADEPETERQTQSRLKAGSRQPNAHDHTTDEGHLNAIGATEV